MLSNRSNTNRLLLQLKHDSEEKSKERHAKVRHDVYLQIAEQASKAGSHLGTLPQLDPIKVNLADGLNGFLQAAAKLQLIASPQTANLVGDLTVRYMEVLFKLIAKVQPMHDLKIEINICNDFYDRSNAEVNRVLAAMTQHNESAANNPEKFLALQNSFDNFQKVSNEYAKQREAHWNEYNSLHKQYVVALLNEMKGISELQILVTSAIRKELELDSDSEGQLLKLEENRKKIQEQVDSLLESMQ